MQPGIFLRGGEAGEGAGLDLAWLEGWSPLQGCSCAHPGPSLAAVVYLRGGQQVQSQPKHHAWLMEWHEWPPLPVGWWSGATAAVTPALPGPAGAFAPGCLAKIPTPEPCAAPGLRPLWHPQPCVPRAAALRSRGTQGVPPTASFLLRQDQRQDLTWTAFY